MSRNFYTNCSFAFLCRLPHDPRPQFHKDNTPYISSVKTRHVAAGSVLTMSGRMWTDNFEPSADVSDDGDYIKRVYLNSFTCDPSDENGNSLVAFSRVIQLLSLCSVERDAVNKSVQCTKLCDQPVFTILCLKQKLYFLFSAPYFLLLNPLLTRYSPRYGTDLDKDDNGEDTRFGIIMCKSKSPGATSYRPSFLHSKWGR